MSKICLKHVGRIEKWDSELFALNKDSLNHFPFKDAIQTTLGKIR